jgi:hypothetical protein
VGHSATSSHQQEQELSWTPVEPPIFTAFRKLTTSDELDVDQTLATVKETTVGWKYHANNPLGWWCCVFEWLVYFVLAGSLRLWSWTSGAVGVM